MRKTLIIAAAMILSSTAMAADFDARIVNLDGSPLLDEQGKEVELTVRAVAIESLMTPYKDEQGLSAEEKLKRDELARKIFSKSTDSLTSEDIATIKKLVNKRYPSPLVVSQALRALEKK